MNVDKTLILNKLKNHYSFKKDADFARFLDIKPQTLASWYSRSTFDIELLYAKCNEISAEFLLTGKGEMLRNSEESNPTDKKLIASLEKNVMYLEKELEDCKSEKKLLENNKSNV